MKNIKSLYLPLVFSFLFLVASCSSNDEVDTEKPTIKINLPKSKAEGHYHLGDELIADVDVSDNGLLASWKIDIHWAGDGHNHDHSAAVGIKNYADSKEKWKEDRSGKVSGKEAKIKEKFIIPNNIVDGDHHFCIYVLDVAGNQEQACSTFEIVDHGDEHGHH